MTGEVDAAGRALILVQVRSATDARAHALTAWIDTAFNGELVIPSSLIATLGLPQSAGVQATLADGTLAILESFECVMDWFGEVRQVEVVGNEGKFPLLGIGLLRERKLIVDYSTKTVDIL